MPGYHTRRLEHIRVGKNDRTQDIIVMTIILMIDVAQSVIFTSLQIPSHTSGRAIAAIVVFIVFGILVLVTVLIKIAYTFVKWKCCKTESERSSTKGLIASRLLHDFCFAIGLVAFFVGDNLPTFVDTYGEIKNCDSTCQQNARIASKSLLFAAFVFINFVVPVCPVRDENKKVESDYNVKRAIIFPLTFMGYIVNYDIVFTGTWQGIFLSESESANETCISNGAVGSSFLAGVASVSWCVFVLVYFFQHGKPKVLCLCCVKKWCKCFKEICDTCCDIDTNMTNDKYYRAEIGMTGTNIVLLCFIIPLLLLADNTEPLGCFCNGNTGCSETTGNIIRVVLLVVTFLLLLFMLVLSGISYYKVAQDTNARYRIEVIFPPQSDSGNVDLAQDIILEVEAEEKAEPIHNINLTLKANQLENFSTPLNKVTNNVFNLNERKELEVSVSVNSGLCEKEFCHGPKLEEAPTGSSLVNLRSIGSCRVESDPPDST